MSTLPKRPLTDVDLKKYCQRLTKFRGVFMWDCIPKKAQLEECGIINLDDFKGLGTHWVAYYKNKNYKEYFDSFGNLQPPLETINYLKAQIHYNYEQKQDYNTIICGHLCLQFLFKNII